MKVTSKILPKSQAELTIELSVEEVEPYIQKAAKRIAQEVSVKGFRKGKVPYDILKKHVGEAEIYEEAFNDMVEGTYPTAVDNEQLMVVGRASIDVEKIAPGNPVVYKATVPLMPKVTLGDYHSLTAQKPAVQFDEKKYTKTLEDLRRLRASEKLVLRAAQSGDKVVMDFEVTVGGVPIEGGSAQQQSIVIGEGMFIPGFEEQITGMQGGEKKEFTLTFPEKYKKDLAGRDGVFTVKVHDVFEVELPELSDEFAKELQFESLEKMQKNIRENIERELGQEVREQFEREIIEEVLEKSQIDELPDQLVDEEVEKMFAELRHSVTQEGLQFEDYLKHLKKSEEELRTDMRVSGEKRIKAALVMRELAVVEKVTVDAAEIQKEIDETRKSYENIPEALAQIDSTAYRARIENRMMHEKTFERLESFIKKDSSKTLDATDTKTDK